MITSFPSLSVTLIFCGALQVTRINALTTVSPTFAHLLGFPTPLYAALILDILVRGLYVAMTRLLWLDGKQTDSQ